MFTRFYGSITFRTIVVRTVLFVRYFSYGTFRTNQNCTKSYTAVFMVFSFRIGITPSKTVLISNKNVIEASNRSPYWTRWDHNGEPLVYLYLATAKML